MTDSRAHAAYYESEAALRLVDQELDQLRDGPAADDPRLDAVRVSDLPVILERANGQIHAVLSQMRDTRQALQCTSFTMLRNTHAKIQEVTVATEDAAIDILDACDRASHIVDELDAIDAVPSPDRGKAQRLRATLRDELFMMMGALQFQDITAQQLAHASAVLVEMEMRLTEIAALFDATIASEPPLATMGATPDPRTYDPNATTRNAEARQQLADTIFTKVKAPAA